MSNQLENPSIRELNTHLQNVIYQGMGGQKFGVSGTVKGKYQSDRGHVYFVLDDNSWSINCMLASDIVSQMPFTVQNHMTLDILGNIGFYDRQGQVQINVQHVRLVERGLPDYRDAEKYLKSKGLWGLPRKPLPKQIKSIYLITSAKSKAVADFRTQYNQSAAKVKIEPAQITVEDVPLEGESAPASIAEAIHSADTGKRADVIVLTRGGGDFAKLATFNDPIIAEAICRSQTPIVVGIGHAEDNVFAEKVADVHAITPTDAAVKIVEAQKQEKKSPCAQTAVLLMTLLSVVSTLVLLAMMFTRFG